MLMLLEKVECLSSRQRRRRLITNGIKHRVEHPTDLCRSLGLSISFDLATQVVLAQAAYRVPLLALLRSGCIRSLLFACRAFEKRRIVSELARLPQKVPLSNCRRKRYGRPRADPHLAHSPVSRTAKAVGPGPPQSVRFEAQTRASVNVKVLARREQLGSSSVEFHWDQRRFSVGFLLDVFKRPVNFENLR